MAVCLAAIPEASPASQPDAWNGLAADFAQLLEKDRIVGGSIALVQDGKIVAQQNYGYADKATGLLVDDDTIYHWASITKTLNGITVMQLRDHGVVSLEDPITRYVPELRRVHNPYGSMDTITIHMLLNHSAGFQGSTWPYRRGEPWEPFEPTSWNQLVAMMPYEEIGFPPGSRFSYSNPAWIYLARALEKLTGDPWEYYVQKNIFTPLGMTRSYFNHTPPHLLPDRSSRYIVQESGEGAIVTEDLGGEFDPGITIPNGGWNAPLADAAAYVGFLTGAPEGDDALRRRYDSVLKRSTLEEMWEPELPAGLWEGNEKMGLTFFLTKIGARRIVGHTGSQGGFVSFLYCDPASGRGIVGALNTANGAREEGASSAFNTIRRRALEVFR